MLLLLVQTRREALEQVRLLSLQLPNNGAERLIYWYAFEGRLVHQVIIIKVVFQVHHDVLSGLKYLQVVKRKGFRVSKDEEMLVSDVRRLCF